MNEEKNRRRANGNATAASPKLKDGGGCTPMISRNRPPGVPKDVWRAYGRMYPGGALRWLKRAEELRGTPYDPFKEPPEPGAVINLTNYAELRRKKARELWLKVMASAAKVRVTK